MNSKPWVLGLASSHNGAACLLHGERVVAAIQEERLLRMKRAELHAGENCLAIQYCLDAAGITAADLNAVVNCPTEPAGSIWMDLSLNPALRTVHHRIPTFTIGHHAGHAIGAFVQSGFAETAVLVVDASGSRWKDLPEEEKKSAAGRQLDAALANGATKLYETISFYYASGTSVMPQKKWVFAKRRGVFSGMRPFGSLGEMYSAVGRQIFGSFSEGPGKVMGLAPYGSPTIPVSDFFTIVEDDFVFSDAVVSRFQHNDRWPLRQDEYRDLAASTQNALEEALFFLTAELRRGSGSGNFCFAGGVALNSVANEKIVQRKMFEHCFFMPAAEDSGTAVGAAFYGLWQLTGGGRPQPLREDSAGKSYSKHDIKEAILSAPGLIRSQPEDAIAETVKQLAAGKIVGWFEGGSELGPRALGHRSVLCDPRDPDAKDTLNNRVKFREGFRPFAPCVLAEAVTEWFDVDPAAAESPFMMRVMSFRKNMAQRVPAVVHVDGTGRVQTVTRATPRLYALISRFHRETGVPMLLNTSFNIAGEPIVETPEDAIWCFLGCGMDCCVLEDMVLFKEAGFHPILDCSIALKTQQASVHTDAGSGIFTENGDALNMLDAEFLAAHADSRIVELELAERYPSFRLPRLYSRFTAKTAWGPVKVIANRDLRPLLALCDGSRSGREILEKLRAMRAVEDERAFERLIMNLRRMSIVSLTLSRERAHSSGA